MAHAPSANRERPKYVALAPNKLAFWELHADKKKCTHRLNSDKAFCDIIAVIDQPVRRDGSLVSEYASLDASTDSGEMTSLINSGYLQPIYSSSTKGPPGHSEASQSVDRLPESDKIYPWRPLLPVSDPSDSLLPSGHHEYQTWTEEPVFQTEYDLSNQTTDWIDDSDLNNLHMPHAVPGHFAIESNL